MEIEALLKSLGMETFINYYSEFEKKDRAEILTKFSLSENWTIGSQNTKASIGISLFERDLNDVALLHIINKVSSERISEEIREKAIKIYEEIENDRRILAYKIEKALGELSDNPEEDLFWDLRDLDDERKNVTG